MDLSTWVSAWKVILCGAVAGHGIIYLIPHSPGSATILTGLEENEYFQEVLILRGRS